MEINDAQRSTSASPVVPLTDDQKLVDALRILSIDQVQAAGSGHPGAPMGLADVAFVLWRLHLRFNPLDPHWVGRDRVIFSNGHCSALQYSALHLCGYQLDLDELKAFRQLSSKTPGHPEFGLTPGVEATTGPLGQGLANGIGMALAQRRMAAEFNTADFPVIDHRIYIFVGDGCLMEGISHEAMSLAGQWGLGKLIVIYDQNKISIDGDTDGWFAEDCAGRARACRWHVIENIDGHDRTAVDKALGQARDCTDKPSLVMCRTQIGYGSPTKAGSADCHGAPLGRDEVSATRAKIGWDISEPFVVPDAIRQAWDMRDAGAKLQESWQDMWRQYRRQHPELARAFCGRMGLHEENGTATDIDQSYQSWSTRVMQAQKKLLDNNDPGVSAATRSISGGCLEQLMDSFPELVGGSADLSGSNCVISAKSKLIDDTQAVGNFLHYGAREFAMVAINNGVGLYGGQLPYSATFLVFTDYARNAIRMSALMKIRHLLFMTHDSIALGEDGPTHQPVEHLESLRLIPGLEVWRPSSVRETIVAWTESMIYQGPSLLALTRQKMPTLPNDSRDVAHIARGGYIFCDCDDFDVIIIGAGSELHLAVSLASSLHQHRVRVVSMPNRQRFLAQSSDWRDHILPPAHTCRIAIEAGCCGQWRSIIGDRGLFIGIEHFGHSAPATDVARACGLDLDGAIKQAQHYLESSS